MSTVPTPSVGRLGDRAAVRSLRFDDVVAIYAVDGVVTTRPETFFPSVPSDYWSARPELHTGSGDLLMSAGGLLVEIAGTTVLVDAGVGPMTSDFVFGSVDCGSMVDVIGALGRRQEDIDVVAFTHLHFDHAGWAYANGTKTFPNARYIVAAKEWAPYEHGGHAGDTTTPWNIIEQLASEDSAVELIGDGDDIVPGVRALVTSGHTPGHTSYVFTSRAGRRLVAFGDAFHMPGQLAHPDWLSAADSDHNAVIEARRRLLAELSVPNTVGFGFHFGDQPFGRVATGADGQATWEPVPTLEMAPPPR